MLACSDRGLSIQQLMQFSPLFFNIDGDITKIKMIFLGGWEWVNKVEFILFIEAS